MFFNFKGAKHAQRPKQKQRCPRVKKKKVDAKDTPERKWGSYAYYVSVDKETIRSFARGSLEIGHIVKQPVEVARQPPDGVNYRNWDRTQNLYTK